MSELYITLSSEEPRSHQIPSENIQLGHYRAQPSITYNWCRVPIHDRKPLTASGALKVWRDQLMQAHVMIEYHFAYQKYFATPQVF